MKACWNTACYTQTKNGYFFPHRYHHLSEVPSASWFSGCSTLSQSETPRKQLLLPLLWPLLCSALWLRWNVIQHCATLPFDLALRRSILRWDGQCRSQKKNGGEHQGSHAADCLSQCVPVSKCQHQSGQRASLSDEGFQENHGSCVFIFSSPWNFFTTVKLQSRVWSVSNHVPPLNVKQFHGFKFVETPPTGTQMWRLSFLIGKKRFSFSAYMHVELWKGALISWRKPK